MRTLTRAGTPLSQNRIGLTDVPEIRYELPLVKWAVIVEESGLPTEDALDALSKEQERSFLGNPLRCERIEKARHFIFDEMMVRYREWGYDNLAAAVKEYVSRFGASQKTKNETMNCVIAAYRRKGVLV
jgi:hypothetical protein